MSRDLTCLDSFCVAGAVFGEFGVRLPVAGAAPRAILGDSRRAKYCIFHTKSVSKMGRRVLQSGGCEMTIFCSDILGISSEYHRISSNRLSVGRSTSGSWQAQYFVSSKGDFTGSTHWK